MSKNDKSTLEQAADKVNDAVEEIALKAADAAIEPDPKQVAAAMFTPASLIAPETSASAPGVFSISMTRSNAIVGVNAA